MSSTTKAENLIKVIKWLTFLILLTPLVVIPKSFFPFIFWKVILFRILVEIVLMLYILLLFEDKRYLVSRSCLVWAMIAFLGALILTTLTSLNSYRSFWSNQERMEGLVTLLHFIAWFFVLVGVFKKKEDWYWFFKVSFGVSLAVSFYAFLQKINVSWGWVIFGGAKRLSSTIGNPVFLAAYLLPHIFLGVILALRATSRQGRVFYFLASFFELLILYWTASRGALAAIIIGIFCWLILVLFQRTRRRLKFICLGLILLIIISGLILYQYRDRPWLENNFGLGLQRLLHTSFRLDSGTGSRFLAWQIAFRAWQQKPILGWGPENYIPAFNANFDPEFLNLRGTDWFDRAHNKILDTAVTSGLVGAAAYLAVFSSLIFLLIRYWFKTKRQDWLVLICLALFLAYFIQNFFVFDTPSTYLLFFLLLGFVQITMVEQTHFKESDRESSRANKSKKWAPTSKKRKVFIASLIFVMFLIMVKVNLKPAVANYNLAMSFFASDTNTALECFQTAMFMKTFVQDEARKEFAKKLIIAVNHLRQEDKSYTEIRSWLEVAISEMQQSLKRYPHDPSYYIYLARLYNLLAISGEASASAKAEAVLLQVKELSPLRPEIYYELATSQMAMGHYQEAANTYQQVFNFAPSQAEAHWGVGLTLTLIDQLETGLKYMLQADELGYFDNGQHTDNLLVLARTYSDLGQDEELIGIYNRYLRRRPNDLQVLASLAAAYAEIGDWQRAERTANQILEIKPDASAQVEQFIQGLKMRRATP